MRLEPAKNRDDTSTSRGPLHSEELTDKKNYVSIAKKVRLTLVISYKDLSNYEKICSYIVAREEIW